MSEVSGRAWSFFETLDRLGMARLDEILEEIGAAPNLVRSPRRRISWDFLAALTDATHARLTPEQVLASGRFTFSNEFLGGLFRMVDVFGDATDVYRLGMTWIGPSMYRSLAFSFDDRLPDRLHLTITVKDGFRPCQSYFEFVHAMLIAVPELIGQQPADVDADISPTMAAYRITVHQPARRSRVRRALRALSLPRAITNALGEQQRQISTQIEQLQESESGYAALLDALPAAVMLVENRRVVYANPALAAAIGRDRHALIAQHLDALVHPDDRIDFATMMTRGSSEEALRFRMVRPDGTCAHLEGTTLSGVRFHGRTITGLSAIDVTSRVDTEARLEQSQDTLRGVIAVMPDVLIHLRADGTILNVFGGRLLAEGDLDQLKSCPDIHALFANGNLNQPDLVPFALELLADVLRTRETRHFEFNVVHGINRTIEGRLIPLDHGDELIAFVRDITEPRRQERQLALSERMASVGTLAAGVAHEINSPLAFVSANLALLRELLDRERTHLPAPFADSMAQMVRESSEGTRRVDEIVRALGQYARPQTGDPEPTDVEPAIHAAIALTGRQIRQRATLELAFGQPPLAVANSDRLTQVIVNLLVNAIHALGEGTPSAQKISVRTFFHDAKVCIEVADTGHGIAPDVLTQIFDPFFTTKPVGEGSGLGLFISHRMIREFGGTLSVTSALGVGTTMRIELQPAQQLTIDLTGDPTVATVSLTADAPTITPDRQRSAEPAAARRPSILVVDDEPLIGTMMTRALAAYDTSAEISGLAVLQRLEHGERPDLILCDLMLPGMTGMEIYERACAIDPSLRERFLFMTGGAFTASADAFAREHADDLLDKPVGLQDLRDTVAARLARVGSGAR